MRTYHLVTDGSAVTYAKVGGWAYLRRCGDLEIVRSGAKIGQGSNQMELLAIVEGLQSIQIPSRVIVYTDSHYVIDGVRKQKHQNMVLWSKLYLLLELHVVTFVKVGSGFHHPEHIRTHHAAREAVFDAIRATGRLRSCLV